MSASSAAPGAWRLAWRVSQHSPRVFWLGFVGWVVFFAFPLVLGLLLEAAFGALDDGRIGTAQWLAVTLLVAEVGRMGVLWVSAIWFTRSWVMMQSLLRANLLAAQVASGGDEAGRPVASAGEALAHFRDDTEDVAWFVDGWLDLSGAIVFAVVALGVLATIDPVATAVILVPMAVVAVVTRALDLRIKAYRRADREATATVSGLIGDVVTGALTVKVNDAAPSALARLERAMDARRRTATRDRVLDDGLRAFGSSTSDIGLGLVLVVAAGSLRAGELGVGELALFSAYLTWLGLLPRMVGMTLTRRRQASVAFERMSGLVAGEEPARTAQHRHLPLLDGALHRPDVDRPARIPLERLDVEHLTATYPDGAGVRDVSFSLTRGSFTVITGPVGAGKSTLLRAVLGLTWREDTSGTVRWNGEALRDPAAFLVPPRCAYLPQVPQLLSDTLADNVLLGLTDDDALREALALAAVDDDVAAMADGPATVVGPRGLRLSGGQRQRLAAARALVHRPELVVVDDLSSAVDVATEIRLWENLAAAGTTVLAVSHRAVALDRADQVIELDGGRPSP